MRDRRGPLRCSFCGKGEPQVRKVVAGPGVHICDQCVRLCVDVLTEDGVYDETPRTERIAALEAEIRRLHGLLRLESQLVKDLRIESERLKPKKTRARPSSRVRS